MITNNSIIDDAYNRLSNAYYYKRDRKAIEDSCKHCQSLGIPNFQELANAEMTKLYSYRRIKTYPVRTSIECLPPDVLGMYALACMDVLFNMKIEGIRRDCQYAYQTLSQPVQFQSTDVLYIQDKKRLTVGDFLKVVKYALALVDIVYPDNKVSSIANPIVWALQGIDDALNNKSKTELTNHSLHIATDFLASSVKESLNDTNAKRSVAVSALMVNLAIDFLVKDNQ
jgi:hypothetical protein